MIHHHNRRPCACEMRGFLRFIVMRLIKKNPGITGREIREEIKKRRGRKPSPGTIYPVLKTISGEGWAKEDNKKYTLTKEGEKVLKEANQTFIHLFHDMKEEFLKHH